MVVSRDWPEVSVLECILSSLHIGVDVETEPERARAKLGKSKVDALIVDCDLEGTARFLRGLERSVNSVPLVIVSGTSGRNQLTETGATFVFEKPISVEQAVHTLSAARNMIVEGRLRYHRHAMKLPVSVSCGTRKRLQACLLNLSQGGMGIRLGKPCSMTGAVRIGISLPGSKSPLKVEGEVVWNDQNGNAGVRFLNLTPSAKESLQLWLAQQFLTQ